MIFPILFKSVQELIDYLQQLPRNLVPQIVADNLEKECSRRGHPPSGVSPRPNVIVGCTVMNRGFSDQEFLEAIQAARQNAQRAALGLNNYRHIPVKDGCRIYFVNEEEFAEIQSQEQERQKHAVKLLRKIVEAWESREMELGETTIQEIKSFLSGL